jgi:hypothetical protein
MNPLKDKVACMKIPALMNVCKMTCPNKSKTLELEELFKDNDEHRKTSVDCLLNGIDTLFKNQE